MFRKNKVIAPGSIKISHEYYRVPYLMIKIKLEAIWQKISLPKSLLNVMNYAEIRSACNAVSERTHDIESMHSC